MKNDERDARDLADLLRLGRLADAWIAPLSVRGARELLRYREVGAAAQSAQGHRCTRSCRKKEEGVLPGVTDMFGPKGQQLLDAMKLADAYLVRVLGERFAARRLSSQLGWAAGWPNGRGPAGCSVPYALGSAITVGLVL